MKKCFLMCTLICSFLSYSQIGLENFLVPGKADGKILAENYFKPACQGVLFSVNNGWFTTAKVYREFGFEVSFSASAALVPYDDRSFNFNPNAYNYLTTVKGETSIPNVMSQGNEKAVDFDVKIPYGSDTYKVSRFTLPNVITQKFPLYAFPVPMLQFGIGLPYETDLKFRFVPSLNFAKNDVDYGVVGLSLVHDLTHYFGVDYDDSRFGLSVMGGFTNIDAKYNFYNDKLKNSNMSVSKDAGIAYQLSAWNVQLLGSMDFEHMSFYGAYGYQEAYSKLEMEGTYNLKYDIVNGRNEFIKEIEETIVNPFRLDFDETGTRKVTVGMSLSIANFMKLYGEYVFQYPYDAVTSGLCFFFK